MTISGTPTAGLEAMSARLASGLWMAVGTGTGTFSDDETTLYAEVERVPITVYSSTAGYFQVEAALAANEAVGTLSEVGVFDAASGGAMWRHIPISPAEVKPATEGLLVTVRIPIVRQEA
jgi:hypothetical protein